MAEKKTFIEQVQKAAKGIGVGVKDVAEKTGEGIKDAAGKAGEGIKSAAEKGAKGASDILNKAHDNVVHAIDVNGDGKFDFQDIKNAAGNVGETAQKAAENVKKDIQKGKKKLEEKMREAKIAADLKSLRPIFRDTIDGPEFAIPKLLMITDGPDRAHKESEACKDSVGFINKVEKMDVVTIYKNNADVLGVEFYPDENGEVYYVDPSDRDHYISLDEYFEYLKNARLH